MDKLFQVEALGLAPHKREVDDPKSGLELRVGKELVQNDFEDRAFFKLENQPDRLALPRFIVEIGDAVNGLVADKNSNALKQGLDVNAVRDFVEYDCLLARS